MSVLRTVTVTTFSNPLVIDDWDRGSVSSNLATATIFPPTKGYTVEQFTGTVYAPIPLPDVPGVLQDISLDSISISSECRFSSRGVSIRTKRCTAEIKYGTTTKGHITAKAQDDRTIFIVDSIGEWSKAELIDDQLRIYFSVDISAANSSASAAAWLSASIYSDYIEATWLCTYSLPLIGKPIIIGG